MEYTLVTVPERDELIDEVNRKISEGWKPLGGISCSSTNVHVKNDVITMIAYSQAMIKE